MNRGGHWSEWLHHLKGFFKCLLAQCYPLTFPRKSSKRSLALTHLVPPWSRGVWQRHAFQFFTHSSPSFWSWLFFFSIKSQGGHLASKREHAVSLDLLKSTLTTLGGLRGCSFNWLHAISLSVSKSNGLALFWNVKIWTTKPDPDWFGNSRIFCSTLVALSLSLVPSLYYLPCLLHTRPVASANESNVRQNVWESLFGFVLIIPS